MNGLIFRGSHNVIDAKDSIYAHLKVWIDANSDGISTADELKSLEELHITSIDLNAQEVEGSEVYSNIISDTSTFTHEDKTLTIENYSKEDKSLSIDLNSYLTLEIEDARFKEGDDTHNEKIGFKLIRVLSDGTTMTHKAAQDMVYTFQIGSASYAGEIKKGNSGGYVEFTIHGDTVEEEDEKLQVKLMNPPSGPEGNPIEVSATITIIDDDTDDEPEKPEDEIPSHPWQHGSPLVLDLNNDGITSQSIQTNKQYFDLNNDGIKESMAWVQKSDGILVLDKDANSVIKDGNELFGNYTKLANGTFAPNGFEALKELDENKDGIIDAKDAIYKDLRVWIDANQDALNNEGELKSLGEINTVFTQPKSAAQKSNTLY